MTAPDKRRAQWIMIGLFALSIAVRAAVVLSQHAELTTDEGEHVEAATNLVRGVGYALVPQQALTHEPQLTAYRAPGAALIMALAMLLFGVSVTVVRVATVAVASCAAPLLYRFARTTATMPVATAAGVACAVYPTWVYTSVQLLSEAYFVPILIVALTQSVYAVQKRTLGAAALAGLALGATTLVKPLGFPLAVLIGGYFFYTLWRTRSPRIAAPLAAMVAGYLAIYSPWVIRNAVSLHRPIPFATEGGETMLGANNPYVLADPALSGMWVSPMNIPEYRERLGDVHDDVERSRLQNQIAIDYLKTHPSAIPTLIWRKEVRFLTPVTHSGGFNRLVVLGSYGVLLLLLVVGAARRALPRSPALDVALIWLVTMLVITGIFWGNLTRGRMPLEVAFLPWGVISAASLWKRRTAPPPTEMGS